MKSAETTEQKNRKFTFGRLMLVLTCLMLAYCAQKEVRYAWERKLAEDICEDEGGGGLRSNGPVEVAGYLHLAGSTLVIPEVEEEPLNSLNQSRLRRGVIFHFSAKFLLDQGFDFIEIATQKVNKNEHADSSVSARASGFARFTLEKRPSPLCAVFDGYLSAYKNYKYRRTDTLIEIEDRYWQRMELPADSCIGVEEFSDPDLLKSEFELIRFEEIEPRLPRLTWRRNQVRNRHTGEIVSEYASFWACLGAYLQIEPFFSGCAAQRNNVQCPVETSRRKFNPVTRFQDEAFAARKK